MLPSSGPADITQAVLSGIRILDFSWVLAGPYATRLLADFGAEVIKVQPLSSPARDRFSQGYYNTWNRNKLAITLNLEKTEGIQIARKLIEKSDVVVENFSPRVMSNWGLDYPEAKKIRPDIIFLSLSVMGHSGPRNNYSGYGPAVQALSGATRLTSYPDLPPAGIGFSYADHIAGLYASLAILGALEYQRRTGLGQYIDLSETEAMTSLLFEPIIDYACKETAAGGYRKPCLQPVPEGIYACLGSDAWCAISVSNEDQWKGFKRALGSPTWAEDARFKTIQGRKEHSTVLDGFINAWTSRHSAGEVMAVLQKEGVPAGAVQNARDLAADPQLRARGFFPALDHPVLGKTIIDANPIHLSENPVAYRHAAPAGGQDNEYIYRHLLGLSDEDLARCRRDKVI